MSAEEMRYHQEVLILAYIYLHNNEIENVELSVFKNNSTRQLFQLMRANYNFNNKEYIDSLQIVDAMLKNKNFQSLIGKYDLIYRVFAVKEEYIVTKAIFDNYVRGNYNNV